MTTKEIVIVIGVMLNMLREDFESSVPKDQVEKWLKEIIGLLRE